MTREDEFADIMTGSLDDGETGAAWRVSVVIPVYNGGDRFRRCLEAIRAAEPAPDELIVVADGDTDGSGALAAEYGARIIRHERPQGPAAARNAGARLAAGEILFFIDADVELAPTAVARVRRIFQDAPQYSAVMGSYDDDPSETNFLSQYKNLMHHYTHQTALAEASTFWGACGAIRRSVFLSLDGFDETFRRPSIEDIELGYRLRKAGGRILLDKGLQVRHLKRWEAANLLRTEIFCRALPWTRLILREGGFINDLNVKFSERMSVILVHLLLLGAAGAPWFSWLIWVSLCAAAGLLLMNKNLYRFFLKKRGLVFALKSIPWHWFYFVYSGQAFLWGWVFEKGRKLGLIKNPC